MAKKLFNSLFGRQLSHGSENEEPASLEEAFSEPPQLQQNIAPPLQLQQNITPDLSNYSPPDIQLPQNFQLQQQVGDLSLSSEATPGGKEMNIAYNAANFIVRDRIMAENPEDIAVLDSMNKSDIVVVRGTYDHIHLVLEAVGIPFMTVNPADLMRMELRPEQTVYVNCPSTFPPDSAKRLEKFVKSGGQLITTDWALKNVIEVAFPNTIKFNGRNTGDEVVSIEIVAKDDDVLKGFIDQEKDAAPVWWLECSSYPIQILDKKKVKVLVRSDELKRKYGADPVIVSFEHGEGIVYHMLSHFYLQRSETRTKKHAMSSEMYIEAQNISAPSKSKVSAVIKGSSINYGAVQSASTSCEFVSRGVLKQKKKFASNLK